MEKPLGTVPSAGLNGLLVKSGGRHHFSPLEKLVLVGLRASSQGILLVPVPALCLSSACICVPALRRLRVRAAGDTRGHSVTRDGSLPFGGLEKVSSC